MHRAFSSTNIESKKLLWLKILKVFDQLQWDKLLQKQDICKLVSNIARDQLYILSHLINPNEKMYIALQL